MSLKFVPKGPIDKQVNIGSGNGLAPDRRQAIIWTNVDQVHWRTYAALGVYGLTITDFIHVLDDRKKLAVEIPQQFECYK